MAVRRGLGVALIVVSAACFGAMPIFARAASAAGADTVTMLALRFSIAAAMLWGIVVARRLELPSGRTLVALVAMGGVGYVGQAFAYFRALEIAPASLVALLFYLYPVVVTAASVALKHERMTTPKAISLALALGGTAVTLGRQRGGDALGVGLAALSGLLYAAYLVAGSRLMRRAGPVPATAVIITSAAAVYTAAGAAIGYRPPAGAAGWAAVVALAAVSTVVALATLLAALRHLGAADVATISAIEPALTVALAAAVLGEPLTWGVVAGGAMILAAVVLLARAHGAGAGEPAPERAGGLPCGSRGGRGALER